MSRTAAAVGLQSEQSQSTIRRYRDVVVVLVKHGLADVVDALHLGRYLGWSTRALPRRARMDTSLSRAARVRLTLEELGPTYVKFGQALSVRSDLLPPEYIAELTRLQEHVAPLPAGMAEAAVEAEFNRPLPSLFSEFDPVPLAAASIAQAHRAVLPSGEPVVVKVRRPGIDKTIAGDLEMLRQLARLAARHVAAAEILDPVGLVDEFARMIRAELDLVREARNIERCAANFAGDETVRVPRVHWDRTTAGVLTMERLEGLRIGELDAAGLGVFARRAIARRGADAVLKQVLVHGFFHADPHPGNLLVLPGYVIGFLDFGIVGRVDDTLRGNLAGVVRAIWNKDAAALAALAMEIARVPADVDVPALERDLAVLMEAYGNVPLGDLQAAVVLTDIVATAARHRLRIPSNLMLLIKTLVTIEGVGMQLDPSFKMVEHAAPLAERLWRQEYTPAAIGRRLIHSAERTVTALRTIPVHLEAIARKVRDGRLEIRFVHRNLDYFVREMDRSSNRLAFALIIAALIIGSSSIVRVEGVTGYPALGLTGFLVAGVLGIGLAIGIIRSGRL